MKSRIEELKNKLKEVKIFKIIKKYRFYPKTHSEFIQFIKMKSLNRNDDLNDIDVSNLKEIWGFSSFDFFKEHNFFVDEWNVSRVVSFDFCFFNCKKFNCDLSGWDTSNGVKFNAMFRGCDDFNQSILNFDISNGIQIFSMFEGCKKFNQELYNFKLNYRNDSLYKFFESCFVFNQDISMWDVSNVEKFSNMFENAKSFKQDLSGWNVSSAKDWYKIFDGSLMEKYPKLMPEKFRMDYI